MADEQLREVHARIDALNASIYKELTAINTQLAQLAATLAHPDQSHCVRNKDIDDHERRITALETDRTMRTGANRVWSWITGGKYARVYHDACRIDHAGDSIPAPEVGAGIESPVFTHVNYVM